MLRRAWKPLTATAVAASAGAAYFLTRPRETFDLSVPVRGADGKRAMSTQSLLLQPFAEVEARIREHATASSEPRPNGVTWNHTTARLASNNPMEDANAHQMIQRDASDPAGPGDYLFYSVFDGHGGFETSQLLSRTLIRATALELAALNLNPNAHNTGVVSKLKSIVGQGSNPILGADPEIVSKAIQRAFVTFDAELLKAPIRLLAENWDEESRKQNVIPDLSKHPMALQMMLPAMSGSCALMSIFDTAHDNLYVALAGDCRAVAGVWEPTDDGKGKWRVDVLTEDQTGRNPNELKRIQSEHPMDEENDVVRNGRILGGLEPSRAFGDARYKWTQELQAVLNHAFMVGNNMPMRRTPPTLKTPPYVTSLPVVTHRKLSFTDSGVEPPAGALRFLVMATDGLWDALSSEEVVRLVGGHLNGLKGFVPKLELPSLVTLSDSKNATVEGKASRRDQIGESWAFKDDNLSAHLIRNALGGDDKSVQEMVSIPSPLSRRFRDDITVTVVWWEHGNPESAKTTTLADIRAKAKL